MPDLDPKWWQALALPEEQPEEHLMKLASEARYGTRVLPNTVDRRSTGSSTTSIDPDCFHFDSRFGRHTVPHLLES